MAKVQRPGKAAKQIATAEEARRPHGQVPGSHGGMPRTQLGGMQTAKIGDGTGRAEEEDTRGGTQPLPQSGALQNGITVTRSRGWQALAIRQTAAAAERRRRRQRRPPEQQRVSAAERSWSWRSFWEGSMSRGGKWRPCNS